MKREILFRGKVFRPFDESDGWVYGYFVVDPAGMHRIYLTPFEGCSSNTYFFVKPETVGQFTGLIDSKKVQIFEGDIWNKRTYPQKSIEVKFEKGKWNIADYLMRSGRVTGNIHK